METEISLEECSSSLQNFMMTPELYKCFEESDLLGCYHISLVTANMFWVSDEKHNFGLVDTTHASLYGPDGIILLLQEDLNEDRYSHYYNGPHTVNNEHELIYINRNYDIIKRSRDMDTLNMLIKRKEHGWEFRCVYWSPFTKDLLVGMCSKESLIGKITRYNQTGHLTQTIQEDNTGLEMFQNPNYITDNIKGDIVVSDSKQAVVVTERDGTYRFSYTGHPPGSELCPYGICTDLLSNILVCDGKTNAIHILDRNGQFLSHFLTKLQNMTYPRSVSYDFNTRCLWVGSREKKVCVYSYITQQDILTG